jgi:tRNA (guanine-N7-)-methyltransferase
MARGRHPTRIHIDPPDEQTAAKYFRQWSGGDLYRDPHVFPRLTSPSLFGNSQPLEIDVGCGTGVLVCDRALKFPETNFLGIDQSCKPLYCAVREAATRLLENIRFIRGDINFMLPLLQPRTVNTAYYLLPNPPRDYHIARANERRRVFLHSIYNALAIGGRFYFATDSNVLFEYTGAILKSELGYEVRDIEIAATGISTQYLRRWHERGRSVKSCMVVKR